MKKSLILATLLTAAILIPGLASATHITELVGSADCEGWNAAVSVHWRSTIFEGSLDYAVVLLDEAGVEVTRFDWTGPVTRDASPDITYLYGDMWNMELCGDYTVVGTFHLMVPWDGGFEESTMEFTAAFTCECEEPGGCFLTPGYWKNHEENWAQNTLMIGGVELSQEELLFILDSPVRGDATVILAKHLIAAKLNVLNGADDSIQSTIDEADDYLVTYPVFSRPAKNSGGQDGIDIKDVLADYNEQGCEEEEEEVEEEEEEEDKASAVESTTWDNLKAIYQ